MICGGDAKVEDISPILDVHKIIQDWAWNQFIKDAGCFRKLFIRRKDFIVDVQMNFYQFEDSKAELKPRDSGSESNPSSNAGEHMPNTSILSTDYHNDTDMDQVYKFRMERARKACMTVTFQKGFTIGGSANFSIGVVDGNLETSLQITKTTEQTFEETLTFETNSDINVKANTNCVAQVVFTEREMCRRFTVDTIMRMPSGKAPVYIRRRKDQKVVMSFKIQDLRHIFHKYKEEKDEERRVEFVRETIILNEKEYNNYAIKLTTRGIIEGMRLSGQTVKLHSKEIESKSKQKKQTDKKVLEEHLTRQLEM
ncbi:uncharacterized protein LOC124150734 isoform X2 [Haliotis rufescens]|nr:uncharacterized protein LOC124150734 isoform X2 [Haliotis rufescens]XP_046378718.2 uncharacterized protein LOC124150734 isoform X2 [Haliotis rufescens]XP_048246228.1 uncharacterized protein LOC124150734 isoform X2 [Haliotis rufescens]